jgi:pimeloyl-ACP methyl ester carboxylesterase
VFVATVKADGHVIASTTFRRALSRPALIEQDETVSSAGFVGAFESAAGATHRTTVLAFGGSEGGLRTVSLAARLAADGVPTLALAYFGAPGLPKTLTNIPLEYFETALGWLARQPQVDPQRIVVLGVSRGSEAALLLGVHDPDLVHGVIALVPSSVVNCGIQGGSTPGGCIGAAWTLGGKPLWPHVLGFLRALH